MLETVRLEGKVAVVTGASRGLGRAMALALAEAGADVAAAARTKADLEDTARQVERLGRQALAGPTDVADFAQVEGLMEGAVDGLGRLDIVINAVAPGWFVTDMNAAAFDHAGTRDRLLRDVPARRTGRLAEIGPLAVYLAWPPPTS